MSPPTPPTFHSSILPPPTEQETAKARIMRVLGKDPAGYKLKHIAQRAGLTDGYTHTLLAVLIAEHHVTKYGRGLYGSSISERSTTYIAEIALPPQNPHV